MCSSSPTDISSAHYIIFSGGSRSYSRLRTDFGPFGLSTPNIAKIKWGHKCKDHDQETKRLISPADKMAKRTGDTGNGSHPPAYHRKSFELEKIKFEEERKKSRHLQEQLAHAKESKLDSQLEIERNKA
eukprot:9200322-Ditylum_brightwellii.AAC.1